MWPTVMTVCNADETASCHSDPWFAPNGSRQRLCIASAAANQLSGGQEAACESNKLNVQLINLHTVDKILQNMFVCFNQFVHQFSISYIPQFSRTLH